MIHTNFAGFCFSCISSIPQQLSIEQQTVEGIPIILKECASFFFLKTSFHLNLVSTLTAFPFYNLLHNVFEWIPSVVWEWWGSGFFYKAWVFKFCEISLKIMIFNTKFDTMGGESTQQRRYEMWDFIQRCNISLHRERRNENSYHQHCGNVKLIFIQIIGINSCQQYFRHILRSASSADPTVGDPSF